MAILKNAKRVWKALEQHERKAYVMRAKRKTTRRDNKFLLELAFKLFYADFKNETTANEYQNGAEGCIKWAEENVRAKVVRSAVPEMIYLRDLPAEEDKFGRSYKKMWEEQKKVIREALEVDENGEFVRNLAVFCWPRGDGKSFVVCLIVAWFFFNFAFMKIKLSASSKDLSGDVHFSEIVSLIKNSPKLFAIVGKKGILEETIKITNGDKGLFNIIQIMSTASGIASNTNVITQSEAFEMKDSTFFTKWYGSLRNTWNAIGLIDTTVAPKDHWVYTNLYEAYLKNPNGSIYFSYRGNRGALPEGFWHPGMVQKKIDGFRTALAEKFSLYFENLWDQQDATIFTKTDIELMSYIGVDGVPGGDEIAREIIDRHLKLENQENYMKNKFSQNTNAGFNEANSTRLEQIDNRLKPISTILDLGTHAPASIATKVRTSSQQITLKDLNKLGNWYNTDWALIVSIDRSDPLKIKGRENARTVVSAVLKGLPNTKGLNKQLLNKQDLLYLYVLAGIFVVEDHMDLGVLSAIKTINKNLGHIDMACGEQYAMANIKAYCDSKTIPMMTLHPGLNKQSIGYVAFGSKVRAGLFKAPMIPVAGSRQKDIFREEMEYLDAEIKGKSVVYASREKHLKGGVQDDVMDMMWLTQYASLEITAAQFKPREIFNTQAFGGLYQGMDLVQDYLSGLCR